MPFRLLKYVHFVDECSYRGRDYFGISTNEIIIRTPIKSSFMLIKKVE